MKKVLKIIGIVGLILLDLFVIGFILLKILGNRPAAPTDYQQTVQTGGAIEKKYMENGPYEVSLYESAVLQEFGKFLIYYPTALETDSEKYPVIVLCNGSGTPLSKYPAVARHLASWGFLVIGTEENYSWNAFGAEMCLRYLERLDSMEEEHSMEEAQSVEKARTSEEEHSNKKADDKAYLFYQKVDFDNVGVVGHSQGGVGVINAITDTAHKDFYKAAVSLSPTNKELAHNLFWDYDASLINIPIMLISGEGGGDDWVVTGEQLRDIYDDIPSAKLMMRRRNTAHNEVLYSANGYVTAWFLWLLQGDEYAAGAFAGEQPEIQNNSLYQDQHQDLP